MILSVFVSTFPVLAFSLGDTKQVVLCGVEKAEILHVFPMQSFVTCMHWMEVTEESRYIYEAYETNRWNRRGLVAKRNVDN